jgi:uncharacterized membrane protein
MYNHQYLSENDDAYVAQYDGERINVSNFERVLSVALGTLLVYNAIRKIGKHPLRSISRVAAGGALFYRGVTGFCPVYNKFEIDGTRTQSVNIRSTFIINKPKHEVYQFWRKLENLPLFMRHLVSVKEIDSRRSHWEAKIPEKNPLTIRWDAEIVKDEEGSLLSWQSLPGSTIDNAGKVEFRDALGNMGTEIRIMITYRPPAGNIGTGIAKLFNPMFEKMVKEDVNNFKSYMDAGSIAATTVSAQAVNI